MIHTDAITCSTDRVPVDAQRQYCNAAHAAERYLELSDRLGSISGIDIDSIVDSSNPDGVFLLVDEKRDLYNAFIEASKWRRVTRPKFRVWCHIRIGGGTYRGQNVTSKSNVERWLTLVDYSVDCVLDERGMLIGEMG